MSPAGTWPRSQFLLRSRRVTLGPGSYPRRLPGSGDFEDAAPTHSGGALVRGELRISSSLPSRPAYYHPADPRRPPEDDVSLISVHPSPSAVTPALVLRPDPTPGSGVGVWWGPTRVRLEAFGGPTARPHGLDP